jgi:hypothetical protein
MWPAPWSGTDHQCSSSLLGLIMMLVGSLTPSNAAEVSSSVARRRRSETDRREIDSRQAARRVSKASQFDSVSPSVPGCRGPASCADGIRCIHAPLLNDAPGLRQAAEHFAVEAFVAQLVVERFDVCVLPR